MFKSITKVHKKKDFPYKMRLKYYFLVCFY